MDEKEGEKGKELGVAFIPHPAPAFHNKLAIASVVASSSETPRPRGTTPPRTSAPQTSDFMKTATPVATSVPITYSIVTSGTSVSRRSYHLRPTTMFLRPPYPRFIIPATNTYESTRRHDPRIELIVIMSRPRHVRAPSHWTASPRFRYALDFIRTIMPPISIFVVTDHARLLFHHAITRSARNYINRLKQSCTSPAHSLQHPKPR